MRILFIVLIFIPSLALAYPVDSSIGFGTGYTWTEATFNEGINEIGGTIQTPSYSSVENDNLPWDLFASFRFHENYGIELGYIDYGTIKFTRTFTTTTGETENSKAVRNASVSTQGFYISHILFVPLSQNFDFQAKAGIFFGTNDYKDREVNTTDGDETTAIPNLTNASRSISEPQFAIGLLYQYQPDWRLRLQLNQIEYEHIEEKETFSQWFTSFSFEREF